MIRFGDKGHRLVQLTKTSFDVVRFLIHPSGSVSDCERLMGQNDIAAVPGLSAKPASAGPERTAFWVLCARRVGRSTENHREYAHRAGAASLGIALQLEHKHVIEPALTQRRNAGCPSVHGLLESTRDAD